MPSYSPDQDAAVRLDGAWVRQQFPSLALSLGSAQVAYFDNPAGTQVPAQVQSAMREYFTCANANSHGAFATSQRTDQLITRARELMAAFVNADSASEIVFGPNMTTLTYTVSRAFARLLSAGDEVVVSDLDHDANIGPWLALEERGVVIRRIPVRRDDGTLDLARFEQLLSRRTRLVAVGYASNALGTINEVAKISELAHAAGALVFVDAVHYAPHGLIDVRAAKVDFLVCSAYKFFGPHVGVLWGKAELLHQLPVPQVRPAPQVGPEKLETGTKNHEGLAGLVGALGYLAALGGSCRLTEASPFELAPSDVRAGDARRAFVAAMGAIRAYEIELAAPLLEGLLSIRGLTLFGLSDASDLERRVPTFGFTLDGISNAEACRRLAEQGIFAWAGHHYALTLMERLGLDRDGLIRIGAVHYNTPSEVSRLLGALEAMAR